MQFYDWLDDFKPQVRVHLGDNWNFDALRTGASDKDKAADLSDDIEAGHEFLERFFDGGQTNVFLRGNHDERLWRLLDHPCSALSRALAKDLTRDVTKKTQALKARMLPYDAKRGVYKLGRLSCVHGYAHGLTAARVHARVYGECVFGHVHRFDASGEASTESRFARSIGCLARHDMAYCSDKTHRLGWHHGWAYGIVYSNGHYELFNAKANSAGQIVCARDFSVY